MDQPRSNPEDGVGADPADDAPETGVDAHDAFEGWIELETSGAIGDAPLETATGNFGQRASIRRNIFHLMGSQAITWTLGMVAAVIVPRFLGPTAVGQLNVAAAVWQIGFVAVGFGMTRAIQLEIAKDPDRSAPLLSSAFVGRTIGFGIVSLALAGYVALAGTSRTMAILFALFGVTTLIKVWAETYGILFLGLERMAITARIVTSTKLVNTIAMVSIVVAGGGVYAVALVGTASNLFSWFISARASRKIVRIPVSGWRTNIGWLAVASLPFLFAQLANTLYRQVDILVIARLAGDEEVGWYGAADLLVGSLLFPATVIISSVFPAFGRLSSDPPALDALIRRTYSILMLGAVPIGLGTMLVGPAFATLLYGEDFRGTGEVLVVFGPVIILTFATTLFGSIALASGRGTAWSILLVTATALTIPLDLVLVPWASDRFDNGAIGGALAYIATESLQFIVGVALVARFVVARDVLWRTGRILIAGGLMFAAGWPFRELIFLVPVLICTPVYLLSIYVLRVVGEEERQMITRLTNRFRRGRNR